MKLDTITSKIPYATVVIPAYNEEKRLEKTLYFLSKIKTKYPFNVVVVNNSSTDNTAKIANKSGAIIINEEKKGVKYARYLGIQYAINEFNSKIIIQLDADCTVGSSWINEHLDNYKDDKVSIVGGAIKWTEKTVMLKIFTELHDLFRGRLFSVINGKIKINNYFEKREFWIKKGVMPFSGANTSYLSEIGEKIVPHFGISSLGEDYYKATKIAELGVKMGKSKIILKDTQEITVHTPSRGDSALFLALMSKIKYKLLNTEKMIKNGGSNFIFDMSDAR